MILVVIYKRKMGIVLKLDNIFQILGFTVKQIIPFVNYYKKQIISFDNTVHEILTKEISLILP